MSYDADGVRGWFDSLGEGEWARLDATLQGRIRYAIHRELLLGVVEPGMRVADIGSGPGRFAIDAAEAGASVTLVDLSPVMLSQARERLAEAGVEAESFVEADARDLSMLGDASFDLVLCYGGAVSYSYDGYTEVLRELSRIAKPGAPVLVSVMTLVGVMRLIGSMDAVGFLEGWPSHLPALDWERDGVVLTVPGSSEWHLPLALFNPEGLAAAMELVGCEVERFAVANPVTVKGQDLERIGASSEASSRLVELEVALSGRPGLRDSGEHLLALARKRAESEEGGRE